jgi:hypothetical protein
MLKFDFIIVLQFQTLYKDYQNDQDVIQSIENLLNQVKGATVGSQLNLTETIQGLVCGRRTTKCTPGYYIAETGCLPCEVGTYQPSSNQASCIPCKDNLKTNSTASTNASDCQGKFMQERNPEVFFFFFFHERFKKFLQIL